MANRVLRREAGIAHADPLDRSWARGAEGERLLGRFLEKLQRQGLIVVLHDIRIPRTTANVDHVAVAPSGVLVIDAKFYRNKRVEVIETGRWLTKGRRLRVGKWDNTKLGDKLARQVLTVESVVDGIGVPTGVTPVLCFIQADFRQMPNGGEINGVKVVEPRGLEQLLRRPGPLSAAQIGALGQRLRERLRPA